MIHLQVNNGVGTSPHGLTLRTGAIDLEFKTAQRRGLGLSVVVVADRFIRLTDTVSEPTVFVNVKSALAAGIAAWATGGLSLLLDSVFRRLTASTNPCEVVRERIVTSAPERVRT